MKEYIVKNAVNNFLQATNSNSEQFREVCEKFLWESVREVRKEDPFLYEEIMDFSSRVQTELLEQRLVMEFVDQSEILKDVIDVVENCLERSFEINKCDGLNYTDEYFKTVFEDCCVFLAEESSSLDDRINERGKSGIIESFKSFIKKIPSLLVGGGVAQLAFSPMGLGPSLIVLVGCLIGSSIVNAAGSRFFGVNMQQEQMNVLKGAAGMLYKLGKFLKDNTEGVKYRYNVIYRNEEKCYQRSGLDPKKLGIRMFASLKDESLIRQLLFFDDENKLDKLRNCYLEHLLEKIGIFFDLYFDCLRKSGKWNEIRDMSEDKFITMFRMKGGLYPMCDDYRDQAVDAIKTFEDLVKFFFEKSPEQKSKWLLMLNRYILDQRVSRDEQMRKHRDSYDNDKKSVFTSPKYQKYGKDL